MEDQSTAQQPHHGIVDQTLGELLQTNPQAQQMIMQAMGITQEKFDEMLKEAQSNEVMQMKIGDLFKQGIVKQAVEQHTYVHKEEETVADQTQTAAPSATGEQSSAPAVTEPSAKKKEKKSFLKSLFG